MIERHNTDKITEFQIKVSMANPIFCQHYYYIQSSNYFFLEISACHKHSHISLYSCMGYTSINIYISEVNYKREISGSVSVRLAKTIENLNSSMCKIVNSHANSYYTFFGLHALTFIQLHQ